MRSTATFSNHHVTKLVCFFTIAFLLNLPVNAQFCANETVYYLEDFGTGTNPSSHPDVLPSGLTYQANGPLADEGVYRVINNTQQKPEWHNAPDHTPADVNGKMLVVNGQAENFFVHVTTRPQGFAAGFYSASVFLLNVNTPGTCSPNPLLPLINFRVDYRAANNNWTPLVNSPISSGSVPQTPNPTWIQLGAVFTLPTTGNFTVTQIRIRLADGIVGGCGNDFALDDIKLASCPSGGPLPVSFLNINANQKGTGALINWATSSEVNNNYFQVERSNDGGINWQIVGDVKGALNSNSIKNYSTYDAKPVAGNNYYRIKQVDIDGRFKYSITVNLKLNTDITAVSVLTNPFHNSITLDFLSNRNQSVNCRLLDITGKQILTQKISIAKGSSRKEINGLNQLTGGTYILQVSDDSGAVLFKDKLVKQ
ncbi:MAG: T9SS type A sorting domain-containing protein [Ferruginibacter sp.]